MSEWQADAEAGAPGDAQQAHRGTAVRGTGLARWRWLAPTVKWLLFAVVLLFVAVHAHRLWGELGNQPVPLRWGWLAVASAASVLAWLPSVWFWRAILSDLGFALSWHAVARAYYCGHPGKYVPGKAMVLVIRAALLRPFGVPASVSVVTVTLEAAACVIAGVVTVVYLAPVLLQGLPAAGKLAALAQQPHLRLGLLLAALAGGLVGLVVLSRMSEQFLKRLAATGNGDMPRGKVGPGRFAAGLVVFLVGWWLQGATLGFTIQAISPDPVDWREWPRWTGTAAASIVGGFLAVFAPGGLGVREGLTMELLRQQVGPHEAVAVALLMRGVSLVGELVAAALLYFSGRGAARDRHSGQNATKL